MSNVHPMKCPSCEHTIRATNLEWLYEKERGNRVIPSGAVAFTGYSHTDERDQLYYCPNDDCRVERLLPGEQ